MQTIKSIVTGVAAVAAVGATAVGVGSIAAVPATPLVRMVAVGVPLPQDPASASADIPTVAQLTGLMNSLTDPSVSFANKGNLVEGGIGGMQAHIADGELQKAARGGELPLTFNFTNIQPAAPGSVTSDVVFSGPKLSPVTENLTFVDQGGWVLSRHSAIQLVKLLRANGY